MKINRILLAAIWCLSFNTQAEISNNAIHIGILTDASGPYSDAVGQGALVAAEMAVEDYNGKVAGKPIVIHFADHQNNAERALSIAKAWHKEFGLDMINELASSTTAIPVQQWAKEQGIITIVQSAGSSSLTGKNCSPTGIHWAYDTYALANGIGKSVAKNGGDKWFVITLDNAFGRAIYKDVSNAVIQSNGKMVDVIYHPYGHTKFHDIFAKAKASEANVIAIANAGTQLLKEVELAKSAGTLRPDQKVVNVFTVMHDIRRLGLLASYGLQFVSPFYWNKDDATRLWSERFIRHNGSPPSFAQAGVYSSITHYLNAIKATKSDNGPVVVRQMKRTPINDFFATNGKIRADGRMVHDMYLLEVKTPIESAGKWDYFKEVATIAGDDAFRPISESQCDYVVAKR